jgi:hypothetical protein
MPIYLVEQWVKCLDIVKVKAGSPEEAARKVHDGEYYSEDVLHQGIEQEPDNTRGHLSVRKVEELAPDGGRELKLLWDVFGAPAKSEDDLILRN